MRKVIALITSPGEVARGGTAQSPAIDVGLDPVIQHFPEHLKTNR